MAPVLSAIAHSPGLFPSGCARGNIMSPARTVTAGCLRRHRLYSKRPRSPRASACAPVTLPVYAVPTHCVSWSSVATKGNTKLSLFPVFRSGFPAWPDLLGIAMRRSAGALCRWLLNPRPAAVWFVCPVRVERWGHVPPDQKPARSVLRGSR